MAERFQISGDMMVRFYLRTIGWYALNALIRHFFLINDIQLCHIVDLFVILDVD